MRTQDMGQPLALSVFAIALLNATAELVRPDGRPIRPAFVAVGLVCMLAQAALYWHGERFRGRFGLRPHIWTLAGLVLGSGLSGPPMPVAACLYIVATVEVMRLAPSHWNRWVVTVGAILLFAVNAMITFDLYQGASAGLILAVAGAIAHAIFALRRPPPPVAAADSVLTPREIQVLQQLASGARNGELAAGLRITERTVKAHLTSIYLKLGVASRTGAVTAARKRGVID